MKRVLTALFLSCFLITTAFPQALPVSRMQSAITSAIQQKIFKRGFAANDPRFGSTLTSVSGSIGGVAGTAAAAIVAGAVTAPAWATFAIATGVGLLVSTGVTLAVGGVIDWLFSSNPSDSTPITVHQNQPSVTGAAIVAGGAYWQTSILSIYSGDAMSGIQTAASLNWPSDATSTYELGTCTTTSNPTKTSCLITRVNKSSGYKQTGYAGLSATYYSSGAPGSCQPGFVYKSSSCVPVPASTQPDTKLTAQQAIDALSPAELAKPLNPQLVATLADKAWRDAAAQPGYSGLPYIASDPITVAEVDAVRQANPDRWPTVQDFVSPQPSTNSPWTLPGSTTASTQDPSVAVSPSTNPAASSPLQNLGADPGIGAPTLEPTPTAQQILQPLLSLFPDFRSFVVPTHQATCPKPTLSVFGKSIVMDAHCTISEQQRSALYAVMAAVWALSAAFIILRA